MNHETLHTPEAKLRSASPTRPAREKRTAGAWEKKKAQGLFRAIINEQGIPN